MNKKRMSIMLCGMLLVSGLFISTARAENSIGPNVVTGNEYVCFFVSTVDVFSSQISFTETGGLTISSFGGYGFYITVANVFTGTYIALNARIGERTGDIIMLLVGSSFELNPFIVGTGAIIFEYSEIIPIAFAGFAAEQGT